MNTLGAIIVAQHDRHRHYKQSFIQHFFHSYSTELYKTLVLWVHDDKQTFRSAKVRYVELLKHTQFHNQ